MLLRRRYRAGCSVMVATQTDRTEDSVDCSEADQSPAMHRYSLLDNKVS